MPRLKPDQFPKYAKHKSSGQAVVYLNGREILLGKHDTADSYEKYNRLIAEWTAAGRRLPVSQSRITILELIDRFRPHAEVYYRHPDGTPTGEWDNFRIALRALRQLYGRLPAIDFGPLALEALRTTMIQPRKLKDAKTGAERESPGWSRNYANRQVKRIRQFFKWAVSKELVPESVHSALCTLAPLSKGRTNARETAPVRIVPQEYVEAALPFLSRQLAALVELQMITGARGGELFKLRGCDINMSEGPIWTYKPDLHKTAYLGHERMIHFGPRAKEIITEFLKPNPQDYLFCPADAVAEMRDARRKARKTPERYGNRPGTNRAKHPKRTPTAHYSKGTYCRAIARACDKADEWAKGGKIVGNNERLIPRWHPHQLRHNAATNFRRDYGLEGVQVMLGQKTMRVAEMYAEKNAALAQTIAAAVG